MKYYGDRPIDVCALCDRPITKKDHGYGGLHIYVGRGMCHGGARENIPVHCVCLDLAQDRYDDMWGDGRKYVDTPAYAAAVAYYQQHLACITVSERMSR